MECKHSISRLVLYDLKTSLIQNRWRWLGAIALFIFLTHIAVVDFQLLDQEPGIWGVFLYQMKGIAPYERTENSQFELPFSWLLMNIYFFYLIGDYAAKDLQGYGKQVFLRVADRQKWWLSKCVWVLVSVIEYWLLFLIIGLLYLVATSSCIGVPMADVNMSLSIVTTYSTVMLGVLEVLASAAILGCFQLYTSLAVNPMISIMLITVILVSSCYICTPVLPGNLMMIERTCGVTANNSFLLIGSLALCVLAATAFICGRHFIKRFQFLK